MDVVKMRQNRAQHFKFSNINSLPPFLMSQLTHEIAAVNASLQNQLYENTVQANQLAELQEQLNQRDEAIAYMLEYRQNLEDNYLSLREKMDLLHHEVVYIRFKGDLALML